MSGLREHRGSAPTSRFVQSAAERAAETEAAERTLDHQIARYDLLGMASLPPPEVEKRRLLPSGVRQTILDAEPRWYLSFA